MLSALTMSIKTLFYQIFVSLQCVETGKVQSVLGNYPEKHTALPTMLSDEEQRKLLVFACLIVADYIESCSQVS